MLLTAPIFPFHPQEPLRGKTLRAGTLTAHGRITGAGSFTSHSFIEAGPIFSFIHNLRGRPGRMTAAHSVSRPENNNRETETQLLEVKQMPGHP